MADAIAASPGNSRRFTRRLHHRPPPVVLLQPTSPARPRQGHPQMIWPHLHAKFPAKVLTDLLGRNRTTKRLHCAQGWISGRVNSAQPPTIDGTCQRLSRRFRSKLSSAQKEPRHSTRLTFSLGTGG